MSIWNGLIRRIGGAASRPPRLSMVVIVHNMRREAARTLQTLSLDYQRGVNQEDYEVLVVENGSSAPLHRREVTRLGERFSYHRLYRKLVSPARAINFGVRRAKGEIVGIMIDGACLLTPGTLETALTTFKMFADPLVMTRYFFLGPGRQNETILQGYNQHVEDELLEQIAWPSDGYRLFEIGSPLPTKTASPTWFDRMFESCCLFLRKSKFEQIGGCDERFDLPGGGFLAPDLFRRAAMHDNTDVVQLIGEGVFHQLHGGTTTNTSAEERNVKLKLFQKQYRKLRGADFSMPPNPPYYFGHMPTRQAASKMNGNLERQAA